VTRPYSPVCTDSESVLLVKEQIRQQPRACPMTIAHAPMSTTMTLTMAPEVHACPNCGVGLPDHTDLATDAQKRIEDLEAQVRLLTAKATAAGLSHVLCTLRHCSIANEEQSTDGQTTKTRSSSLKRSSRGITIKRTRRGSEVLLVPADPPICLSRIASLRS
jgi:hypothetical protein